MTASCSQPSSAFDAHAERQAILELRQSHRDAHFNKNAETFVGTFSDRFVSVNGGQISTPSREENIERFQSYFDAVEFIKWDDVGEPEIRFSDDGTLAYVITEKQVDLTYPGSEGQRYLDQTRYAWVAIYRKTQAGWQVECISSTNQEPVNTIQN